jgi:hypothetical protein
MTPHMCRVIDTFVVSQRMAEEAAPEVALGAGLWAVLAEAPASGLPATGEIVTVVRPDGTEMAAQVTGVEVRHGTAAVRLLGVRAEDLPRLSRLRRSAPA